MSPDRAARLVILSGFLYYRHDAPVLSDAEYDRLVDAVVMDWDQLDPARQWQMESAEAMAATGFHMRITQHGEAAAFRWYSHCTGKVLQGARLGAEDWRTDGPGGILWAPVGK